MAAVKALIFDLGKVVFDLSFDRVYQYWATASGKPFEAIKSRFVFDEAFDRFEKSEITPAQFRAIISHRLDLHLSDEDFDNGWCNLYLDKYPGIDRLLIDLKSRYRIVALTNTNTIHAKVWPLKYAETLSHFEKIFSSHELLMRKPETRIYEMVLEYLQLKPEQTLFLDDNSDNINGAQIVGMSAILVTSPEQMMAELRRAGVMI